MIRKAVIPAAGFGTRFLPASKSQPKEMLPIVDTPTIQYVVEEAAAAGITDILMVIGKGKRAIEEHFDRNFELEHELTGKNKLDELEQVRRISALADIHFVWQKELRGLGDAVACAQRHVGDEPFALLLGDTIIDSPTPVTRQLMAAHERCGESVLALETVAADKVDRYGIIAGHRLADNLYCIEDLVEKPAVDQAPSQLAVAGRYILTPQIFEHISRVQPGRNGEIQLTDAMRLMLQERALYGLCFDGARHDIGNKLDFIRTNLVFGLKREDMRDELRAFLKSICEQDATGRSGVAHKS